MCIRDRTEGNFSLYNVEGKPGAIGRIPPLLAHRFPAAIVRVDMDSGSPVRGEDGLCIACARGDAWFRTGDLMRLDEAGFFHFVDRVGDTFRWKGENVATSEVNEAVADSAGVVDAATYGIAIPGTDGRAGMVAIVADDGFDLADFHDRLARRLPAYACPVMVRFCNVLDTTETFKQKKHQLAREGFDPRLVTDPLFFKDPKSGSYRPVDADAYARILDGSIRL